MKFMPFVNVVVLGPEEFKRLNEERHGPPLFEHYQAGYTQEYVFPLSSLTEEDIRLLGKIAPGAMSHATIVLFNPKEETNLVQHMLQHHNYHSGIVDQNHLILARTLAFEAELARRDIEQRGEEPSGERQEVLTLADQSYLICSLDRDDLRACGFSEEVIAQITNEQLSEIARRMSVAYGKDQYWKDLQAATGEIVQRPLSEKVSRH
jgi:hypothetical protein